MSVATHPFKIGSTVIVLDESSEWAPYGSGDVIDIDGDTITVNFGYDDEHDTDSYIDVDFHANELGLVISER